MTTNLDLLTTRIFTIDVKGEQSVVTLPGLLALLGTGAPLTFCHLRAHQQHPLHAFLVQLAAIVCNRTENNKLNRSEAAWRTALQQIAGPNAFSLVNDNLTEPAFLQAPVPENAISTKWHTQHTPDAIDVVMTARNIDVRSARIKYARPEHWVYALIALQTHQGYLGAGNYGISRMNGGSATRPGIGITSARDEHDRFVRDVKVWLKERPKLLKNYPYRDGGIALVWTVPWDGKTTIAVDELDPYFIEICRRVRFEENDGSIVARTVASKDRRIQAKLLAGDTGDIWTPIFSDGNKIKALNIDRLGFSYSRLAKIAFSSAWRQAPAAEVSDDEDSEDTFLVARGLARGEGKTQGYHERWLMIPQHLGTDETRAKLGELSEARLEQVGKFVKLVLREGLYQLVQGGKRNYPSSRLYVVEQSADRMIDAEFFDRLFADADKSPAEQARRFSRFLVHTVGHLAMEDAAARASLPTSYREIAVARARSRFSGRSHHYFPEAYKTTKAPQSS